MANTSDHALASAIAGEEAKRFLSSELGRIVCGFADQEVADAVQELVKADPADITKIRAIQLKAQLGSTFRGWLTDLINDGEESMAVLKQQQHQG